MRTAQSIPRDRSQHQEGLLGRRTAPSPATCESGVSWARNEHANRALSAPANDAPRTLSVLTPRRGAESHRTGRPFKTVVNEYLRAGLAQRRAANAVARFRVEPVSMGAPLPGRSYDNIGALLEEIEGAERV